jgi:hypothetical protein
MELSILSIEELQALKKEAEAMADLYKTRQNAFKTLGNSLYGSLGTPTFRFYDADIATAITLSGQAAINKMSITTDKYLSKLIGEEKEYIIAGDTDSAMINVSDLVKKLNVPDDKVVEFLAKFGETKLATAIDAGVQEFNRDTNAFKPRTAFKREKISRGILVQKKRYLFYVFDNEGVRYANPELSITGLESQRSSTPEWCRNMLKKAYKEFFTGTEESLQKLVKDAKTAYMELPITSISAASSANNLDGFIGHDGNPVKGAPMHIKGAIAFNRLLTNMKLDEKYTKINSGDKVKVITLFNPNPAKNDTIAFSDKIPVEFNIEKYVDKNTMFNKFFYEPLQRVAEIKGWNCTKTNTLF